MTRLHITHAQFPPWSTYKSYAPFTLNALHDTTHASFTPQGDRIDRLALMHSRLIAWMD